MPCRQAIDDRAFAIMYRKGRSNSVKGAIARLIISHGKEFMSISSIIFARCQHASRSWSSGTLILGPPFGRMGGSMVPFERALMVSY